MSEVLLVKEPMNYICYQNNFLLTVDGNNHLLSVTHFPYLITRNIFGLLAQRELSPQTKNQAKNLWTKPPRRDACPVELKFWGTDARHDLLSW